MRAADERGDNDHLEWRKRKKRLLLAWATSADEREALVDLMLYTYSNLESIQSDKAVIDERDRHRASREDRKI